MKFKDRFIKHWKINLIVFLASIAVAGIVFLLVFFLNNQVLKVACDTSFVCGGALIGVGLLCWIAKEGFFDFGTYGIKQFGHMLFNRDAPSKYDDFAQYKEVKNDKRYDAPDYYLSLLAAGALYIIAAIVLCIVLGM